MNKVVPFSKRYEKELHNGYKESIEKGIGAIRYFGGNVTFGEDLMHSKLEQLKQKIQEADAIVIGAGAGMSTAAGYIYKGPRFDKYFSDFADTYGITEMYSGGFYPFSKKEIFWAYWSRYIYVNRYIDPPKKTYNKLWNLVKDKDYFVITTNVDHCFQKAGFDKKRLFYTQGDYGLFQSVNPHIQKTYDNEEWIYKAMEAQGFRRNEQEVYVIPEGAKVRMEIPTELIPKCEEDGSDMTMNLRSDDGFVEDEGWHRASAAYGDFLRRHENMQVLYLELGVGGNTPVIIKYPFWQMTSVNPEATYVCINYGESYCPREIQHKSICIDDDIDAVLEQLL